MTKTSPHFFISQTIGEAWKIFKSNWKAYYGILLIPAAIGIAYRVLTMATPDGMQPILGIIYTLIQFAVGVGVIKVTLSLIRGQGIKFAQLRQPLSLLFNYFLGCLLLGLIVIGGLIMFIIPGLIWAVKYGYIPYLIADKGIGPLEAMRTSAKMTDGIKWDLIGAQFAIGIFAYAGLIFFIVGLLATIPAATLAYALLYNQVLARVEK